MTGFAPAVTPVPAGATSSLVQRLSGFQGVEVKKTAATGSEAQQAYGLIKRLLTFGGMASCAMAMMCLSACSTTSGGPGASGPSIAQTSVRLSPGVQQALRACDGSAASIARCRAAIGGMNLSPAERASAYRAITEKVTYRNQRNTPGIGDSMCNVTSMAMALNGLGIGADETHMEFEKRLADELSSRGWRRTDEGERLTVARSRGVTAQNIFVRGSFNDAAGAKRWYAEHVQPRLDAGAQAMMSITVAGASGHVLHIVGCDHNGLVVNDPFSGQGRVNGTDSQSGYGRHALLLWSFVAEHNASKYVSIFSR